MLTTSGVTHAAPRHTRYGWRRTLHDRGFAGENTLGVEAAGWLHDVLRRIADGHSGFATCDAPIIMRACDVVESAAAALANLTDICQVLPVATFCAIPEMPHHAWMLAPPHASGSIWRARTIPPLVCGSVRRWSIGVSKPRARAKRRNGGKSAFDPELAAAAPCLRSCGSWRCCVGWASRRPGCGRRIELVRRRSQSRCWPARPAARSCSGRRLRASLSTEPRHSTARGHVWRWARRRGGRGGGDLAERAEIAVLPLPSTDARDSLFGVQRLVVLTTARGHRWLVAVACGSGAVR